MFPLNGNKFAKPSFLFSQEIAKMNRNELLLEDILSNNDIVQDIKDNPNSPFLHFFHIENILKLIDYSLKIPKNKDDYKICYQFPFNATEILCSNNPLIQEKFFYEVKNINLNNNEKKDNRNDIKNININFQNYKGIEKIENQKIGEISYIIIDYIFDFLKESNLENNSNYVLVGYFNKILNNLIDNQSEKMINYIYNYPDKDKLNFFSLFINHMSKKAICNILLKILLYENEQIPDLYDKKIIVSQNIVKELQNTDDNIKYENICNTICKALENKKLFQIFMKDENFIKILFELLNDTKNDKNKSNSILNLHIKINEQILKNFERKFTHDIYEENQNDFLKAILGNDIKNIIDEKEEKNYIIDQSIIKDI